MYKRQVYIPGRDEVAKEIVSASYVKVRAVAEGEDTALFCSSSPPVPVTFNPVTRASGSIPVVGTGSITLLTVLPVVLTDIL